MTLKSTHKKMLSVVVPVYNEEESLFVMYDQIKAACEKSGEDFEILFFLDDGSKDKMDHSRVASASHPAEALARTGLGHFDHPAPPL